MPKKIVSFIFLLFLICPPNVQAMEKPNKEDEYILERGRKGLARLELQDELLKPHTMMHLNMANLSKEATVYDLGSGPGLVTVELAKRAKHVFAVDSSEEQLLLAQERVKNAGLTNVTFLLGDIRSFENFPHEGEVDMVYIRCVLAHVNNPEKIIEVIKKLLKPKGFVLSTEPVISSFWAPSQHQVFREWRELGKKIEKKLETDYDIGERLTTLFDKKDFNVQNSFFVQQGMNVAVMKELFALDITEGPQKAVALGALTQEKVDMWAKTIREWDDNDPSFFHLAKFASVVAQKL